MNDNKFPPKRASRPAKRAGAPRESNVYQHPDLKAQNPATKDRSGAPASPWQRADPGPRAPRESSERPPRLSAERPPRQVDPARATDRAPPRAADTVRASAPGVYARSDRSRPDPVRDTRPARPAARAEPEPDFEVPALIDERDAQRRREVRIYGRAACLAVAEDRFEAIRKLYCTRLRAREIGPLLARLAAAKIGFNEVEDADLERLTAAQHHEGLALDVLRKEQPSLPQLFASLARQTGPVCLIALEGVGNPHNFGAILRSAVHFGARAVLIPADSTLTLAGAVYRVAEGAAERVPVVRYEQLADLRAADFTLIATAAQGERSLYRDPLPARSIVVFGAEGGGLNRAALDSVDARFAIPGSGRVDSLNVAQSVAVVLGEWWRSAVG